jgi:branched-chain amino acid transport system permease protein
MMGFLRPGWVLGAIGVAAAIAAPYVLPPFLVSILTLIFIATILAASVNLLAGQAGLVSIGHAGIAAAASYGVAWASVHGLGVGPQLGIAAALVAAVSLVYGLTDIARPEPVAAYWQFYFLTAAVLGVVLVVMQVIRQSPLGLTFRGVRDSESRMSSLGYSVATAKLVAILFSGLFAGVAGVLAVWNSEFISPAAATFARSAMLVVMVIVGGVGTALGPLVGASIVVGIEHWVSSYVDRWPTLLGFLFIAVVLFAPAGVVGAVRQLGQRWPSGGSRRRRPAVGVPNRDAG